ncbi:uncharacterized protein I303_108670 [Kwoniella dejecticola CBS 10117]|uniref:Pleiotropic drug resistance protein n=1 Tax=Kwoniella dejecticola CBS 10117 TaxID=1296121 RepID=A0A1A5ZWR4_9TREE|nr:pleiotropic drug resistance protein [Kwoniella dejecticola CBS 10117]OBR82246.1 pleiotropic drug resistance protein [Kwoniella dejecticola CBS 10117]
MSSFFSRSTKSASSSSSSLAKQAKENATSEIFTQPCSESSVKKKWDYDAAQLKQIEDLKAFTQTLVLPASDPYHPWELRFLNDPGTHPRYMRAAKWKFEDAKKRIQGTLEWRREYKPELIEPGDVGVEAETGKIILTGFDYDSRPILYMRPGRENTERSPRQIRHLIYHLERAIDFMPPGQEQVAIIVDYKSATSQSNPSIAVARQVLNILQNHYVERLGRGLVVNMPWWINAFFTGISPFLDPITRDKIRFNPKLTELVPVAQLDSEFGGDYEFDFQHAPYWKTITEFCHIATDGSRISDSGEKIYPPSGNGIKAALEGLHPVKGAVATGQVEKIDNVDKVIETPPSIANTPTDTPTPAQTPSTPAEDVVAAGASTKDATAPAPATGNEEVKSKSNGEILEGAGSGANGAAVSGSESGLEEGVKRMSLNRALTTAPGAPEGEAVFDHPPSEGELKEARQSLEGK